MPKEYLISEAFNSVFCTLAPSPIHGVGVFALKDIPKNIIVFSSISWDTLDSSILKKIDESVLLEYAKKFKTSYEGLKIPARGYNSIDFRFYLNHSTSCNLNYDSENDLIISKDTIYKNTELTINYKAYGLSIDNSFH